MRKIKKPKIGEYVLATRWRDKDPHDPSYVGFIKELIESPEGFRYIVEGSFQQWRHIFRITKEEGESWLKHASIY